MEKTPKAIKDFWKDYAGMKRDAERYRWLRKAGDYETEKLVRAYNYGEDLTIIQGYELDAAIDAAMQGANT